MKKGAYLLLFVLLGMLFFVNLGGYGLLEPDEARYAEIPREMLETGDFITPRLNYVKYFEKPPLHYWFTALSLKVFGENEWGARFFPALTGLLGIGALFLFARTFWGERTALFSAGILGTGFLWGVHSQLNITDMPLAFFLTLGLLSYYMGIRKDSRWLPVFYASMALGVLTKGLIGIVLPGGILFLWICWRREWNLFLKSLSLKGFLLFFALTLPWFVLVWRENPEFGWFFFVHEHFLRYTTTTHGRYEPWWYFLAILPLGLLPWTGAVLQGLLQKAPEAEQEEDAPSRGLRSFLFLWAGFILFFFSLSGSKLIPYILPALPPLALFGGIGMAAFLKKRTLKGWGLFLFWPLIFALLLSAYSWQGHGFTLEEVRIPLLFLCLASPLAAFLFSWYGGKKAHPWGIVFFILLGYSFLAGAKSLFPLVEKTLSGKALAQAIHREQSAQDTILCYGTYVQGLPFYLNKRIVLGNYIGELYFGKNQEFLENEPWFLDKGDVRKLWEDPKRPVLLVLPQREENFWEELDIPQGIFLGKYDDYLLFRKNPDSRDYFEQNLKIRDYSAYSTTHPRRYIHE